MRVHIIVICAILILAASAAPALAATQFKASGKILAPNPESSSRGSLTQLAFANTGERLSGIDGWIIDLPPKLRTFTMNVETGTLGKCDLDVWFYDADAVLISGVATSACAESGEVPPGASLAVVNLWFGANVPFEFVAEW